MTTCRLGLREQAAFMRLHWPQFRTEVHGPLLRSFGQLQPTAIGDVYSVKVSMRGGMSPEVRVIEPKLLTRTDLGRVPHMYDQERLCLHTPMYDEWTPSMPISVTIVPWAVLWLHYYEVWHATGEWLGGGHEPDESKEYSTKNECHERFPKPR